MKENDLFHVHTYRCDHADMVNDEEYIKLALKKGFTGVWFTDHAPFPKDPFICRMDYDELDEYISTLKELQKKYQGIIDVHIGLEIEYFQSYKGYYEELLANPNLEILLLGEHISEKPGCGIALGEIYDDTKYMVEGLMQGIESGMFHFVAHPDRVFRSCPEFGEKEIKWKSEIIELGLKKNVVFEKNRRSLELAPKSYYFFWENVNVPHIYGADAHTLKNVIEYAKIMKRKNSIF